MKITEIKFGMLRVPLKTPFKTALRTVDRVEDIVIMVHTDSGNIGYGEAPATAVITGDTHGSIVEAIRHYISPRPGTYRTGGAIYSCSNLWGTVRTAKCTARGTHVWTAKSR